MDEKKEEQTTPDNAGEGSKSETTPLIDIANAAAERMEKANEETARLQEVQSERDQRLVLGGRSEAGSQPIKKSDDEKWAENAKERYEGTGLDPTEDNTPTTYS